ncbi:MAG: metalloregulator ArsR/SmtB family transcription factor [Candidatus Latescibacteria bacterium]|nr:metalloregulator ArsR/SmtB family transcription factor [Candidatus Latescibacterota bacterium]NIM21288.1 metalloregulator ArsR/SmtB family transcription factor [Candidatus Latescibacterota bacterium]NIM64546.1 metalloregulator ArsR/SmtB family transcription factor [Candidatus Latescibacterota bacterium]NIO00703.1 metalloregulator ArsR/SmtB family transcription factor [Candidatus Latescibacterota bacterium]NIO27102.1 metalloregulator ArsR/SmtB family transcription factor [Candidatus Latesciba
MNNDIRHYQNEIYEQLARIGKAISSPRRLELLELLSQGPRTVETIAEEANLSVANASQHLKALRSARLVESEKNGVYSTYRLASEEVLQFLATLKELAGKRVAEIDQLFHNYLETHGVLESMTREELISRTKKGNVTVIDVRPVEEYRAGHLPGAISVPLNELEANLSKLSKDHEIIAYCRGQYCILAAQAVELLQRNGFKAYRFDESIQDWEAHSLAVEKGEGRTE